MAGGEGWGTELTLWMEHFPLPCRAKPCGRTLNERERPLWWVPARAGREETITAPGMCNLDRAMVQCTKEPLISSQGMPLTCGGSGAIHFDFFLSPGPRDLEAFF